MEAIAKAVKKIFGFTPLSQRNARNTWLELEAIAPDADAIPKPIPLILIGQAYVMQMKRIAKQQDMQNLDPKANIISTIPQVQKLHYSGGTTKMSTPVQTAEIANIICPMNLLPVLSTKIRAIGYAINSEALRIIWLKKSLNPSLSTITMGPKYMKEIKKKRRLNMTVVTLKDLYLQRSTGVIAFSLSMVYPYAQRTKSISSSLTILSCLLFIIPILFKALSAYYFGLRSKNLGVSYIQQHIRIKRITEGKAAKAIQTILQFLISQQNSPMDTPADPNAISNATEYF